MGIWNWIWGSRAPIEDEPYSPVPRSAQVSVQPTPPAPPRYGIDAAIALMRALPMEHEPELVLRVVRKTLRSTGVSVEELIDGATQRESALRDAMAKDREAIEQLQRDITARTTHIDEMTAQLAETENVRRCLQDAIENETKVGFTLQADSLSHLEASASIAPQREGAMPSTSAPPTPSAGAAPKPSGAPPLPRPNARKPPLAVPIKSVKPPEVTAPSPESEPPPSEPTLQLAPATSAKGSKEHDPRS